MAFRNIALSGRIACGSTTLSKALAEKLGWKLRDASQMFRDISMRAGFDLEKNPQQYADDIDLQVDNDTISNLKLLSHIVAASKLAGFLSRNFQHTLRILVVCPSAERIRRYAQDRGYRLDDARRLVVLREQEDQKKWERLYGPHDFFDPSFFHLVLDSGTLSVEEEVQRIIERCECCE